MRELLHRLRFEARSERGAAAVEMALTTILLLLLSAGIVDLGRVLYTNVGVQEATQEGAMYAAFSVEGAYDSATDDPPITARILDAVDFPTIDPNLVTIAVDCSGDFMEVAVTVDHPVDLITPIVGDFLGGNINLSRTIRAQAMLGECP